MDEKQLFAEIFGNLFEGDPKVVGYKVSYQGIDFRGTTQKDAVEALLKALTNLISEHAAERLREHFHLVSENGTDPTGDHRFRHKKNTNRIHETFSHPITITEEFGFKNA